MSLKDFLLFWWVGLLWKLDAAGVTPRGLKIAAMVVVVAGVSFWAGTAQAGYLWAD